LLTGLEIVQEGPRFLVRHGHREVLPQRRPGAHADPELAHVVPALIEVVAQLLKAPNAELANLVGEAVIRLFADRDVNVFPIAHGPAEVKWAPETNHQD